MILDPTTFMAVALACGNGADPRLIEAIAEAESGLNTAAIHRNANGTADHGVMQINERNFAWLGLTAETAQNPCAATTAAARVLAAGGSDASPAAVDALVAALSRYNTGSPTAGVANGYVSRVISHLQGVIRAYRTTPQAEQAKQPTLADQRIGPRK